MIYNFLNKDIWLFICIVLQEQARSNEIKPLGHVTSYKPYVDAPEVNLFHFRIFCIFKEQGFHSLALLN